ncbi:hypothetical protein CRU99_01800 [Malaciobacter mytili]|uniref:hypothetical protein n=1 Tax=Malaciobacter mytili TaxID=603050 RepID=UPI00100BD31F|nr:hypothetical protein [Malaciobacter mytili]RXI48018.1 hypothetical protein CRU99_01800 [Malaciobacter mytili]
MSLENEDIENSSDRGYEMNLDNQLYKQNKSIGMQVYLPVDIANDIKELAQENMISESTQLKIIITKWLSLKNKLKEN